MIKVQPSQSRIIKTESADKISLTMPRVGLLGIVGVLLVSVLLCLLFGLGLYTQATSVELKAAAGLFLLPALFMLVMGIAFYRSTWTLERTPDSLLFTKTGLWGTRRRRWAENEVTKLWVEETSPRRALSARGHEYRCYLMVGFRNGRSEEILSGKDGEEFRWLAAMLSERRGERRSAEPVLQVAEPVRRRSGDDSVVPSTLTMERTDKKVILQLRPMLSFERFWWKTATPPLAIFTIAAIVSASAGPRSLLGVFALPMAIPVALGLGGALYWMRTRTARFEVEDGELLIEQNYGRGLQRVYGGEIEFIQTYRSGDRSELQVLLKGKPKLRLLDDRPPDELEWLARFLRVALKGKPVQEASKLAVDATAGDCQVCGEKMDQRVVYCGKCRTPHHEECWSYIGQCSTYGCREIRFSRS